MVIFIASVSIALGVSFLCSIMEAALLSLTPSQVAAINNKHPRTGKIWQQFKSNIEQPIAVILILNTTAHTIGASVAGAQFDSIFGTEYIWLFSLIFTFLMLQYTEILAKTLGVRFNTRMALLIAGPLNFMIGLLKPVIWMLHFFNRPFEGKAQKKTSSATLDEIRALAAMAKTSKNLGDVQERIIAETTTLQEKTAHDVMIPEPEISMLSTASSIRDAFIAAHVDAHTRYPICRDGNRQDIVGYVNFKELVYHMNTNPNQPDFLGIIRPVLDVKESTPATELMKSFIEQHEHVAIVKDSDGNCIGLITLEDLIEELVGDLQDEFDRLPRHLHKLGGGTYMIGGGVSLEKAFQALEIKTEPPSGTLAAWLASEMEGKIRSGEKHVWQGIQFTIRRVRRGKVFEVSASRLAE